MIDLTLMADEKKALPPSVSKPPSGSLETIVRIVDGAQRLAAEQGTAHCLIGFVHDPEDIVLQYLFDYAASQSLKFVTCLTSFDVQPGKVYREIVFRRCDVAYWDGSI